MPVGVLRCRICESEYPATATGICMRCFGPLEPVYDRDELARTVSRRSIEAGIEFFETIEHRAPLLTSGGVS